MKFLLRAHEIIQNNRSKYRMYLQVKCILKSFEWISLHFSSVEHYLQNVVLALVFCEIEKWKSPSLYSLGAHSQSCRQAKIGTCNSDIRQVVVF